MTMFASNPRPTTRALYNGHTGNLGYFVFPPHFADDSTKIPPIPSDSSISLASQQVNDSHDPTVPKISSVPHPPSSIPSPIEGRERELDSNSNRTSDATTTHTNQDKEAIREIVLENEFSWVASGGILRDPVTGMRDFERTEEIRAELALRKKEEMLKRRWDEYERRWKELLNSDGPVSFEDIPWPVPSSSQADQDHDNAKTGTGMGGGMGKSGMRGKMGKVGSPESVITQKRGPGEVTLLNVESFLLDPLQVRGCTVTRKQRIRASILRFHPDRLQSVLKRVGNPEEEEKIKDRLAEIMVCLTTLQDELHGQPVI